MNWLNIHISRKVAEEVGKAAARSGVSRAQAIAAALWVFSRLTVAERAIVSREYIYEHTMDEPAARNATKPETSATANAQPVANASGLASWIE